MQKIKSQSDKDTDNKRAGRENEMWIIRVKIRNASIIPVNTQTDR